MIRLAILGFCLAAMPALAETDAEREERCAAQAGIVEQAVALRGKGTARAAVTEALTDGETAVQARFRPSVKPLVDWVFALEESQLTPEVASVFEASCRDYKQ
ncbi:hypothetical protein DQW77_10590 [Roseovarius sp. TE539]|uniref:hypothetical protein n=1 Tax=Roseovarius sp. TE539 TaxID=2249812 RepID=UPI000DDF876C|nr:hypothetical protein [Roseovarius sp. TE539]RBI72369.1 hypothetical protein DQW77_10590 [Roseovarius sp. TE539]